MWATLNPGEKRIPDAGNWRISAEPETRLQKRERPNCNRVSEGNSVLISRSPGSKNRINPRKLLASFRSDRQISAELHGSSFFTAASTESNGHDSGSENDSALHSLSPDSVPEFSGRD
jgi:hypothetical protein